jgi:hypothetical protein
VCGDTFCEGQYINLWAMRLRCSVEQATGVVIQCVWTFAGSDTRVQASGRINVNLGRYACVLPLAAGTRLETCCRCGKRGTGSMRCTRRCPARQPIPTTHWLIACSPGINKNVTYSH